MGPLRHLGRTIIDMVDGSVAMYLLRDLLGLSTETARERRIARRKAREQADLERRIGAGTPGTPGPAGTRVASPAVEEIDPEAVRARLLRDTAAVLIVVALVVLGATLLGGQAAG